MPLEERKQIFQINVIEWFRALCNVLHKFKLLWIHWASHTDSKFCLSRHVKIKAYLHNQYIQYLMTTDHNQQINQLILQIDRNWLVSFLWLWIFIDFCNCAGPGNIHTPPTEGIGISWGVGGVLNPKNVMKCVKLNWNFQRVGES